MVLHHPSASIPPPLSHPHFIPPSCFCGLVGREQTSWPEHFPEEPAEPAAAGVQGQGGPALPLTSGMDLLRHLHLQHLRLPEGKEAEQEHPAAAAQACQKGLGIQRRQGRAVGWVLYRAPGPWVSRGGQSRFPA